MKVGLLIIFRMIECNNSSILKNVKFLIIYGVKFQILQDEFECYNRIFFYIFYLLISCFDSGTKGDIDLIYIGGLISPKK